MDYATTKAQSGYWEPLKATTLTAAKRKATRLLGGSMYDGDTLLLARHHGPGQYEIISRRTMRGRWHDDPTRGGVHA